MENNEKQNIAFAYLKTGGGHISGARAVSARMTEMYPDAVECFLKDGLEKGLKPVKAFLEDGYSWSANSFEPGYVLFYQLTGAKFVLNNSYKLTKPFILPHLKEFIVKNRITKIVCFHEILISLFREVLNRLHSDIPLISIVMDPFTAHPIWFYEKDTELIVFSKKLYRSAVDEFGFDSKRVHQFPLMISRKFDLPMTAGEIVEAKKKHGIPVDARVLLIAGGGEGLKNAKSIVKEFLKNNFNGYIMVVCGKNKKLKYDLTKLVEKQNAKNVLVFGFVSFMAELMNISDCVVSKGGPATIMETLAIGKPLVVSAFVRGQEYGNVFFVQQNDVGWFLEKPSAIYKKVSEIFENPDVRAGIKKRIENMNIKNGLDDICEFIYNF
ncbi:MAG: glycosyl transferase family 28 [Treponema sp.]|nr:MAG: glycosyl transferase family 28 [Treponema sp.]